MKKGKIKLPKPIKPKRDTVTTLKKASFEDKHKPINTRRRQLPILTLACIVALLSYVSYDLFENRKIYAEVRFKNDVHLSFRTDQFYSDKDDNRISPICGCLLIHPHRGVQFFSRDFDVGFTDTSFRVSDSLHHYNFFSPGSSMGFYPKLGFDVRVILVKKDFYNIEGLRIGGPDSLNPGEKKDLVMDSIYSKVPDFSLFTTSGDLNVRPSENYPFAALIPIKNSDISISKERQPYNRENYGFNIKEVYNTTKVDTTSGLEAPTIDVFGPTVKIITKPGAIKIHDHIKFPNELKDTSNKLIMVFSVMPQLRIIHTKLKSKFFKNFYNPKLSIIYNSTVGKTVISSGIIDDSTFSELRNLWLSKPILDIPKPFLGMNGEMTTWGLPTTTKYNGLYIFSQDLFNISSSETTGSIKYGNDLFDLTPAEDTKFKNLSDFEIYNEPIIVPLSDKSDEDLTKFHANGQLLLDGQNVNLKSIFNSILFWLGALSSGITIFLLLKGYLRQDTALKQNI